MKFIASATVIAGAVSACFMLLLIVLASLYAFSSSISRSQRRVLILTVTLLGVLSTIAVIFFFIYVFTIAKIGKEI
jgi:hypothetical protein